MTSATTPVKGTPQTHSILPLRHCGAGWSRILAAALLVFLAPGCKDPAPDLVPLDRREQLIRLSMDLQGTHPEEVDLQAIEDNPTLYDAYVDRYLHSEAFLDRIMELFNLRFLTRTGETFYDPEASGYPAEGVVDLARSLGDEPLQLIRHIVEHDLPYSEVVTAPYTVSNLHTARWWSIDYPEADVGWIPAHYLDGRPEAGVLSQSTFWHRYPSMGGNANRHRANAISRILLCDDFLSRPIVLDRLAIDKLTENPEDAIRSTDTCQSCHASLDPLASNLFGFFRDLQESEGLQEGRMYRPENEMAWKDYSGRRPGYFGLPTAGLEELGQAIADDPRFVDCAVTTVFAGLTQRTVAPEDWNEFQRHRSVFEASGLNIRSLAASIVRSPEYKTARVQNNEALAQRLVTLKLTSPTQLANIVARATGYRWRFSGVDGLAENARGLAVLAGGVDGLSVKARAANPSLGLSLIQERLAQAAGQSVVNSDFSVSRTASPKLMCCVGPSDRPETHREAFYRQIDALYLTITGLPLSSSAPERAELTALWSDVYSVSASSSTAWGAVVAAVLRDPGVITY